MRNVLAGICLLAPGLALGQNGFMPMLQADRTWCGIEGGWVPTPVEYRIESDTTLADGGLWHRMTVQFEGNPTAGLAGWFHEDTETGQVWMRWDLDLDPGTLWFDFGLEPGDSMVAPQCDWADITCVAVEPFTWTDGTVSRRLTLQLLPDNENFIEYWIEGIGSENGPMGPSAYLCTADLDPHAACFLENGALRHDFALDTTWLPPHPGCTDSIAVNQIPEAPSIPGTLVVDQGRLRWSGQTIFGDIVVHNLLGRRLGAFPSTSSWIIPATGGVLIATIPNGRRLKIRID